MPIIITPKVLATERYKTFLRVFGIFQPKPYAPLEIDILDELYINGGMLNAEVRRNISESLSISPEQLNNYINKGLRNKKAIVGDTINKTLLVSIPESELFSIQIDMTVQV